MTRSIYSTEEASCHYLSWVEAVVAGTSALACASRETTSRHRREDHFDAYLGYYHRYYSGANDGTFRCQVARNQCALGSAHRLFA